MPALPTIADVFRVTLNWGTAHGVAPRNVLHFYGPGHTDGDLATALSANMTDNMWLFIQQDWAFSTVDILPLDGTSATNTRPVTAAGSLTSGDWIFGTAAVLTIKTPQRGSRGRGRVYLGPLAESKLTNGLLVDPSTCVGAWSAFLSDMQSDGFNLGVASYVHADFHVASSLTMSIIPGQIRRRNDQLR